MKPSAKSLLAAIGFVCGATAGGMCLLALLPPPPVPTPATPTARGLLPITGSVATAATDPDTAAPDDSAVARPPG